MPDWTQAEQWKALLCLRQAKHGLVGDDGDSGGDGDVGEDLGDDVGGGQLAEVVDKKDEQECVLSVHGANRLRGIPRRYDGTSGMVVSGSDMFSMA